MPNKRSAHLHVRPPLLTQNVFTFLPQRGRIPENLTGGGGGGRDESLRPCTSSRENKVDLRPCSRQTLEI